MPVPYRVLVSGLSWPRAVGSDLAARAVVSTVPGPTDVAHPVRPRTVSGRSPPPVARAGIALASLSEMFSYAALPLIAAAGVLIAGHPTWSRVLLLAFVALVVLIAAAVLLLASLRSEKLARKLADWLDRMTQRIWKLFRKTPPTGIVEDVLDLRERSKTMLTAQGMVGFGAAVVAKLAWFVVLEIALWCVGIGPRRAPAVGRARGNGGGLARIACPHHPGGRRCHRRSPTSASCQAWPVPG